MKISKIFAGMSALAMAASMAISASAVDQKPFIKDWKVKDQQNVIAFDNMDTATLWNGSWYQFFSTKEDLSDVTLTFTIDTTSAEWEKGEDGVALNESGSYTVLRVANGDKEGETDTSTQAIYVDGESVGYQCENNGGVYTVTVPGSKIAEQISVQTGKDADGNPTYAAKIDPIEATDADGNAVTVYNVGFNIQFGHFAKGTWTSVVSGDSVVAMEIGEDGNPAPIIPSSTESKPSDDSKTDSKTDSKADSKSDSKTDSKGSNTSTTTSKAPGGTTSTTNKPSDETNPQAGAAAGIALAGIALAGAAIVVTKKK